MIWSSYTESRGKWNCHHYSGGLIKVEWNRNYNRRQLKLFGSVLKCDLSICVFIPAFFEEKGGLCVTVRRPSGVWPSVRPSAITSNFYNIGARVIKPIFMISLSIHIEEFTALRGVTITSKYVNIYTLHARFLGPPE